MSLPDIVQTLSSVLEIVLNIEKLWKYLDCTMFKGKGCGSFGLSRTNATFSISGT